ncbi:hypothetical protein RJ55_01410 [Drechmeria coniospora]|nr:hypothetical protein RJ55_01410 [Drechmeria coniospora]
MPTISPGQLAFSALRYLPMPVLVLNSLETVVLANEAMGRMLGIIADDLDHDNAAAIIDHLREQTLVGGNRHAAGGPPGLDIVGDLPRLAPPRLYPPATVARGEDATGRRRRQRRRRHPTMASLTTDGSEGPSPSRTKQDVVVDVVISHKDIGKTTFDSRYKAKEPKYQALARMIITIWEVEDRQTFFTLTFTNTESSLPPPSVRARKYVARPNKLEAVDRKSIPHSNPSSGPSSRESSSPCFYGPSAVTILSSPFPPMGPAAVASYSSAPSLLQKIILIKDVIPPQYADAYSCCL